MQVNSDITTALNVEALIDRLLGDLHFGLAGEHDRKVVTDLLGLRFTPKDSHAAAADIPSRTRSQNTFSRSFNTTLDAINNTSLVGCCYDPLKLPQKYKTSHRSDLRFLKYD